MSCRRCHFVKALLVRWARTGKRLTDRLLPELSLITLSPPGPAGYIQDRPDIRVVVSKPIGPAVPMLWGPRESIFQVLDMRKFTFLKKCFHGGGEIRTHGQQLMSCRRRHLLRS